MNWKKSRIVTIIHQAGDFTITEDANGEDRPFRLDSVDADPEWFSTLNEAKRVAARQNELALFKAENERLREELSLARQGVAFERQAQAVKIAEADTEGDSLDYNPHADTSKLVDADDAAWIADEDDEIDPFCGMDLGPDGRGVPKLQSA